MRNVRYALIGIGSVVIVIFIAYPMLANNSSKVPTVPVPIPTKEIVNTVLTKTSSIDFSSWEYGDSKVLVEFMPSDSKAKEIGYYEINCYTTLDDGTSNWLGFERKGKINTPTTQVSVRSAYVNVIDKATPCNDFHIMVKFMQGYNGSYYTGTIAVKATLME